MKRVRQVLLLWPWVLVLGVAFWVSSPLWQAHGLLYGRILGDGLETPWFYDWTARTLASGGDLKYIGDFGFGAYFERYRDFPSVTDAVLASPLTWFLDWPRQYGAAQGLTVVVNGLGVALLARAMGCRGIGIAVAGVLAVSMEPVWKELWLARLNAAWPGLAAMALAFWLFAIRPVTGQGWKAWAGPLLWAVAAAVLGALAAGVYPPLLVMLSLPALASLAAIVRESAWSRAALGTGAVLLGLILAWPTLHEMLSSQRSWLFACGAGRWIGFCQENTVAIPPHLGSATIFEVGPRVQEWASLSPAAMGVYRKISLGAWAMSLLSLLSRRRGVHLAWLATALLLALLSQGPCPTDSQGIPAGLASRTPLLGSLLDWTWCHTAPLHDFGRFATGSLVITAVLSGVGIEALGQRWRLPGRVLGVLLGLATMAQVTWMGSARALDESRWTEVPTLETSTILRGLGPGVVAELPFDRHAQFLSVLEVPGPIRLNPFDVTEHAPDDKPFHRWLYDLGRGDILDEPPTDRAIAVSKVRWVIFDPGRCEHPYTARPQGCSPSIPATISQVLGPPVLVEGAIQLWDLEAPR